MFQVPYEFIMKYKKIIIFTLVHDSSVSGFLGISVTESSYPSVPGGQSGRSILKHYLHLLVYDLNGHKLISLM